LYVLVVTSHLNAKVRGGLSNAGRMTYWRHVENVQVLHYGRVYGRYDLKTVCKGFKGSESDVVAALPLRSVLRHEELEQFRMTHNAGSASKPPTETLYRAGLVGEAGTESLRCLLI
jgi:hypothetical protein